MRAFRVGRPALQAAVAVAATTLFVVLAAWAALIGPDQVFTGPGRVEWDEPAATRTCLPLDRTTAADGTVTETVPDNPRGLPVCNEPVASPGEPPVGDRSHPPAWLQVLTWTFLVLVLAAVAALVGYVVWAARDRLAPRRRGARPDEVAFDVLDEPARLVEAIGDDAAEQDAALREGDPRNAIVAAWLRFEVQGERAGVGRRPWETSSEYALRILDLVAADAGAVNRLAGLYREARFSPHPVTEDHRQAALDALADVRRSLGVRP